MVEHGEGSKELVGGHHVSGSLDGEKGNVGEFFHKAPNLVLASFGVEPGPARHLHLSSVAYFLSLEYKKPRPVGDSRSSVLAILFQVQPLYFRPTTSGWTRKGRAILLPEAPHGAAARAAVQP